MRFLSDNTATICPEILEAIAASNQGAHAAYGDDPWTQRLDSVFSEFFAAPVRAFVVTTGTAANALGLATSTPPYGAVFAHEEAHIVMDECGAPEFFSGGARVVVVPGEHGKLTPAALTVALDAIVPSVHTVQPSALSITESTELGTTYRPEDIAALTDIAHRRGLRLHMDGARFANALDYLGCTPAALSWQAGVDVLSFGATKNGALAAEAVVFFDVQRVADFELRRKRAGHLISKSRYASAQLLAYLQSGVWRRNAERANLLAQRIARAAGPRLVHPVEANELFVRLGTYGKQRLREAGFEFYDWGHESRGEARLVVSWDQSESSVIAICDALQRLEIA
jgi:threonine aldolase